MNKLTGWLAALTMAAGVLLAPLPAFAECVDPRQCFCSANGRDGGLYRAEVQSVDNNGNAQLEVIRVYEEDPVFNPDILAVNDFFEPRGTEVLIREGQGYLVIVSEDVVRCASGSFGDTLWVDLDTARQLSTVSDCTSELSVVEIRGEFPECDDTVGSLACAAVPGAPNAPFLAIAVALSTLILRRRGSAPA